MRTPARMPGSAPGRITLRTIANVGTSKLCAIRISVRGTWSTPEYVAIAIGKKTPSAMVATFDGSPMPNLASLARDWGVEVTNSIVVDASGMGRLIGAGPEVPIAANYPPHPITQRFTVLTAFPMTRGLALVTGGSNGHIASEVVKSSDQSWAEADLKGLLGGGEVSLDPTQGDRTGPVVIGDRLFLTNSRGEAVLIAPKDGKVTQHLDLPGPVDVPVAVASGTIYMVTDDAELVALR